MLVTPMVLLVIVGLTLVVWADIWPGVLSKMVWNVSVVDAVGELAQ